MDPTQLVRERILAEAAALFVQRGYDGIAMREIAAACGLSKAGIYYHFKDKEDLFLALLDDNLAKLGRLLDETCAPPTPAPECIRRFALAIFTRLDASQRAMIRLASQEMGKLSAANRAAFNQRYQELFIGRLTTLLAAGTQRGELRPLDPAQATWVLLGMLYPFFSQSEIQLQAVEGALEIFFHGVSHA